MHSSRLIFSACLCLTWGFCVGQTSSQQQAADYLKLAEEMMNASQADNDIREVLLLAANADPANIKANFEAGHFYLKTVGKDLAVKYFLRVYERNPGYRFDLEFWIGKSYQYGLEFDQATDFFNRYKQKLNQNPTYRGTDRVDLVTVDRSLMECENGRDFVSHPGNYAIVNLGREVNSEWEDYAPVLNENEDELIFTSRRKQDNLNDDVFEDNKPYEDIFISRKVDGAWVKATNIGRTVNTQFHDSDLGMSADGKTLFIYKDGNGGDIYSCQRLSDNRWGEPKSLPGLVNSSYAEKSVSISRDQSILFFASNRPGGYGGLDIYSATKDSKGEWTNVKNLGPSVNTDQDEDGPFIDYDGVTLYFSSKGWKNMGGFDIYKSTLNKSNSTWTTPENLGYPINTPDNDIYYVSTRGGQRAYYSSVRDDAMGYDDIYMIGPPEPRSEPVSTKVLPPPDTTAVAVAEPKPPVREPQNIPLRFVVTAVDAETGAPVDALIKLQGQRDNVIVAGQRQAPGNYVFSITATEAKDYRLSVEREGYAFQNLNLRLEAASAAPVTQTRNVELKRLSVGTVSVLRNIYFDFDKATFRTESYNELNKLDRMMQQNPALTVEISGHTDNVGGSTYNQKLSQKRAEAVKDFLISRGIDARRIVANGYGEKKPLVSNDDEESGREINRRVEFKVLGNH